MAFVCKRKASVFKRKVLVFKSHILFRLEEEDIMAGVFHVLVKMRCFLLWHLSFLGFKAENCNFSVIAIKNTVYKTRTPLLGFRSRMVLR